MTPRLQEQTKSVKMDLERKTLEVEYLWFVEQEFKLKLEAINKHIEDCTKKFSIVTKGGDNLKPLLLNSPHQDTSFLCTATVDGDKITKAELRVPGRGNKLLRTTIKEHSPWKLRQVQDSANYFQVVKECYSDLNSDLHKSQAQTRQSLERLACSLHQAEAVLILPPLTTAQTIFNNDQKSRLKPELPEDVAVHFHISSGTLVLTVLSVTARSQSSKDTGGGRPGDTNSWLGSTYEHGSITFEVTHQIQVQSLVPWINDAMLLLRQIRELTQDLIDKIKVFDGLGL